MGGRHDSPGVLVPPPLIYVAGFVLGLGLNALWPFRLIRGSTTESFAAVLLLAGAVLAGASIFNFFRHRTPLPPSMGARRLVTTGFYRFSRNPIYLGFTVFYLGAVLRTGIVWALPCLPIVLAVMNRWVIAREEEHLTTVFGDDYRQYCRRVRRWL